MTHSHRFLCLPHVAADPRPEIDEAVAIRSPDPDAHDYPDFMLPILEWLFARGDG